MSMTMVIFTNHHYSKLLIFIPVSKGTYINMYPIVVRPKPPVKMLDTFPFSYIAHCMQNLIKKQSKNLVHFRPKKNSGSIAIKSRSNTRFTIPHYEFCVTFLMTGCNQLSHSAPVKKKSAVSQSEHLSPSTLFPAGPNVAKNCERLMILFCPLLKLERSHVGENVTLKKFCVQWLLFPVKNIPQR